MEEIYLDDDAYDRVVSAILRLPELLQLQGGVADADAIMLAIGECGDVWPASIRGRAIDAYQTVGNRGACSL